jgi:glycogen debranching enzyme
MVEVQGYYYEAYKCLAELASEVFDDTEASERFVSKAEKIKESLNRHLWHEETGYFSLAVNDKGEHDHSVTSNPGHLLFTGILSDKQVESVVNHLMKEDMLTPYGIRTLSAKAEKFDAGSYQEGGVWPFDNWVFYQGLLKLGYTAEANVIKKGLFAAYDRFGNIPEMYNVSLDNKLSLYSEACLIQAWSAGALLNMSTSHRPIL